MAKIKIRGKERKGFRGGKLRHSLWKTEYNKKWIKSEQEQLEYMCTKWDLDPNTFIYLQMNHEICMLMHVIVVLITLKPIIGLNILQKVKKHEHDDSRIPSKLPQFDARQAQ